MTADQAYGWAGEPEHAMADPQYAQPASASVRQFPLGPAFARVMAALDGKTVTGTGAKRMASCPGRGHWRGDFNPSLSIESVPGKVLLYCHAGCHLDDVLAGLGLTAAGLYDDPQQAPKRPKRHRKVKQALNAARIPDKDDKAIRLLLDQAGYDNAEIADDHHAPTTSSLARKLGVVERTVQRILASIEANGWLERYDSRVPGRITGRLSPGRSYGYHTKGICPVDGKPRPSPRAVYCTDRCRKAARPQARQET